MPQQFQSSGTVSPLNWDNQQGRPEGEDFLSELQCCRLRRWLWEAALINHLNNQANSPERHDAGQPHFNNRTCLSCFTRNALC